MGIEMSAEEFEELVDRAIAQIPAPLLARVENCVLVIEDDSPDGEPELFGYYDGIPLSERDSWYSGVLPDRIVIFRRPILQECESHEEVIDEVRITVWHEVAHFFGIEDDQLHDWGYG
ncbi:MAG: metallopeptidase family protein [Micropruina sp.]|nr:metallopeptidase family protein [Micropruina sp.]